ncbi:MAG TPA: hypothetical protein PK397_00100 [Ignavibacteriaceae bacterium]|jgi:hypothetical protein|nr:hypothetical protein [Ignavibacteriaceae bacterium]
MTRDKKRKRIRTEEKLDVRFCTECGEQLDEFDLNPMCSDLNAVKHNHENCKHTGKFKGDMCSKMFISTDDITIIPEEEDED